jgi:hypothetical protein
MGSSSVSLAISKNFQPRRFRLVLFAAINRAPGGKRENYDMGASTTNPCLQMSAGRKDEATSHQSRFPIEGCPMRKLRNPNQIIR